VSDVSPPLIDDDSLAIFPEPVEEGQRFGRYRLCYLLASGGMGSVYLARAEGPGGFEKLVALKRIHAHLARNERFVDMFLDEARIAARIQHPNVCSVIDFGEIDGSYYLTMPYVFGEPLHRVLRNAVRAAPRARAALPWMGVRMVADACEGLHAAHELRDEDGQLLEVVHRDVSPQNLMVGYDGSVRVLDFGVASARHRHYQTSTGEVKGKFAYLAPEQIDAQRADRRADVWALGVVLWESVTGRRLFHRGTMPATIQAVTHGDVPPLSRVEPAASPGLEAVVARALARDPARRYATARAMGRDLLTVLAEERQVVGPADVAEWMAQLFPSGRREQEKLVEQSRVVSLGSGASAPAGSAADAEVTEPSPPPVTAQRGVAVPPPPPRAFDGGAARARSAPGKLRLVALGAVIFVLALAVGIGGTILWTQLGEPGSAGADLPATRMPVERARPGASSAAAGAALAPPEERAEAEATAEPGEARAGSDEGAEAEARGEAAASNEGSEEAVAERAVPGERRGTTSRPGREPSGERGGRTSASRGAREAASQRTPRGAGTVNVATPGGWGLVFLGRRRLGEAPGSFRVPAGTHVLGVQPFGEGPVRRRRVRVRTDRTVHVSVPVR
jgi:serine/threonine-protein kinase